MKTLGLGEMAALRALDALTERGVLTESTGKSRNRVWQHRGSSACSTATPRRSGGSRGLHRPRPRPDRHYREDMSDRDAAVTADRAPKHTWVAGGVLLALAALVDVVARGPLVLVRPAGDWLFAAGAIVFVIGLSPAASVTGRRITGTAATILVAVAPLTQPLWVGLVASEETDPNAALGARMDDPCRGDRTEPVRLSTPRQPGGWGGVCARVLRARRRGRVPRHPGNRARHWFRGAPAARGRP